ncbi:hypothetical protein ADICEAN_00061 [Cesiribacter andamanensis AMV16]|uniref:Uncharacterized protein n=1 Tax=Cesiribacter andamanensis AMV16 TaxID=1279009 RepID=M7NSZ8_9BACT|nr:hypothetical protein ADICEAN_00061 [Cesiribacter andamanensis AMV16]
MKETWAKPRVVQIKSYKNMNHPEFSSGINTKKGLRIHSEAFFIKVGRHFDQREKSWKFTSKELSYPRSLPLVEMTAFP